MEETSEKRTEQPAPKKRGRLLSWLIVAALFLIGIVQALTGSKGYVTTEINDTHLGVSGTYGDAVFVALDTITEVQLVDSFAFGTCVEGEETGNTVSGTYSCDAYGEYTVHAYTDDPCIVLHTPDGVLVFNCGSDSKNEKMYDQLVQAVNH